MNFGADIPLSLLMASVYLWGVTSANIIRVIMRGGSASISVLPLWAAGRRGYMVLSLVNIALLISQIGVFVGVFFVLPFKAALVTFGFSLVLMAAIHIVLSVIAKNIMVRYFFFAGMTVVGVVSEFLP
jgi:hypothetical protein